MQIEVVGVKFKSSNHVYSFDPNDLKLKNGDYVLVDTEKGTDLGCIVKEKDVINSEDLVSPLKKVLKVASKEMVEKAEKYDEEANKFYPQVKKLVKDAKLEMKVVKVEASYDNSRYIVNFTAENRVDFRDLVKKLAELGWSLEKPIPTFPSAKPLRMIDHLYLIAADKRVETLDRIGIDEKIASDHIPVINKLRIYRNNERK